MSEADDLKPSPSPWTLNAKVANRGLLVLRDSAGTEICTIQALEGPHGHILTNPVDLNLIRAAPQAREILQTYMKQCVGLLIENARLKEQLSVLTAQHVAADTAAKQFYPHLHNPKNSHDSRDTIQIFWRTDRPRSIWTVMRDELNLDIGFSLRHIEAAGGKRSCYVDSGEWTYYRENGSLLVSVQCGSTSDRDCDGALCGLNYKLTPFQDFILVQTHCSYNY